MATRVKAYTTSSGKRVKAHTRTTQVQRNRHKIRKKGSSRFDRLLRVNARRGTSNPAAFRAALERARSAEINKLLSTFNALQKKGHGKSAQAKDAYARVKKLSYARIF